MPGKEPWIRGCGDSAYVRGPGRGKKREGGKRGTGSNEKGEERVPLVAWWGGARKGMYACGIAGALSFAASRNYKLQTNRVRG